MILYDYFQNRILQGNLTTYKIVNAYSQTQVTPPSVNPIYNSLTVQTTSNSNFSTSSNPSTSTVAVNQTPKVAIGSVVSGSQTYYTVYT
jgi:hypothetical protein